MQPGTYSDNKGGITSTFVLIVPLHIQSVLHWKPKLELLLNIIINPYLELEACSFTPVHFKHGAAVHEDRSEHARQRR